MNGEKIGLPHLLEVAARDEHKKWPCYQNVDDNIRGLGPHLMHFYSEHSEVYL